MKQSKYNIYYDFNDPNNEILTYNVRTNALVILSKDVYDNITNNGKITDGNFDYSIENDLLRGGFIVGDNVDELELIRHSLLSNRYNTQHLSLTIAPTLNCNFDCVYCYEKNNRVSPKMSVEVQDKIIELIENNVSTILSLSITWYGGEPLLETDIIESLSNRIIQLCNKHKVNYSSTIITNGYKLDEYSIELLKKCNINTIQVTIDGPEDIHNSRRPLIGGQGTFNIIMNNIVKAVNQIDNIAIRINTDKENESRINEVLHLMKEYKLDGKVTPYLGFVEPTNDCYLQNTCLTKNNFSKVNFKFLKTLEKNNFVKDITVNYPRIVGNYCGADCLNSYVIDPNGYLYKCWSDIGIDENRIGCLVNTDNFKSDNNTYLKYMMYDATYDSKCKECICLPICMGGCPRARIDMNEERCTEHKYTLDLYIKETAKVLQSKIQENSLDLITNC